jgi:drug/metabolite transporter (DMT)-like permease
MRALPFLLLLAVGGLIAVGVNLSKGALAYGIEGPEFAFYLSLGAGIVLLAVTLIRGDRIRLTRSHLVYYAVTGFVSLAAPNVLAFVLAKHSGAAYASVSFALSPLITYPLAIAVKLDRPEARRFLGLMVGFVGTALVLSRMALSAEFAGPIWLAVAIAIPACVATGNIYRSLYWPKDVSDFGLAAAMLLASAIWLLPLYLMGDRAAFSGTPGGGELLIGAQVVASSAMYWLYFWLQRVAGPVYLSQIGYVAAGFGVLFAVIFFGEHVPFLMLVGLALIVAGVLAVRAVRR